MREKLVRGQVRRHVGDVDLTESYVSGVDVRRGVPGGGELRDRHAAVDALAGLAEGEKRAVDVAEGDEAVSLGLASGLVEDDNGLLEVAEGGEERAEAVGGGVPAEAADEELALGDVRVRDGAHGGKDVEVARHRVLEDVEELVGGEALDELADFGGGELEGVGRVVVVEAVLVELALLGWIHWDWEEVVDYGRGRGGTVKP